MAELWQRALKAVRDDSDFAPLNLMLSEQMTAGLSDTLDWDGEFLTPLFAAVLLRLDDLLPNLLALGADAGAQCIYKHKSAGSWLCCPLHVAALNGDAATLRALLDAGVDPNTLAEAYAPVEGTASQGPPAATGKLGKGDLLACNALHVLVAEDIFSEDVYRVLMSRGARLSAKVRSRSGQEISGLSLPSSLGNKVATEEQIDVVFSEEIKCVLREATRSAAVLNALLEAGSEMKQSGRVPAFRFVSDVDYCWSSAIPQCGQDDEPNTALLYAAYCGNREAVRLLLYSGADTARSVRRSLPFDDGRKVVLPLTALHLAVARGDAEMAEQLLFFDGAQARATCDAEVWADGEQEAVELWAGLSLAHVAVLSRCSHLMPMLLKMGCDLGHVALRSRVGGQPAAQAPSAIPLMLRSSAANASEAVPSSLPESITPLHLAVLLSELSCGRKLLECGLPVDDRAREEGLRSPIFREMFGGDPVVGLEDWIAALLTGEEALQELMDRRTDITRALEWPRGRAAQLLEGHRLSSPDLVARLAKALEGPTVLRDLRPVHLACMLQQPWALRMLIDAGAPVAEAVPCREELRESAVIDMRDNQLDVLFLSARVGSLKMVELLCKDESCGAVGLGCCGEQAVVPDLSLHFLAGKGAPAASEPLPAWAWCRLQPLELALLHKRTDVAVLLVRLGADLLHTVDHVALTPPNHYSVTEGCFRGLTPLHICALLDDQPSAAALLNEASAGEQVQPGVVEPPSRESLLMATCNQCWATLETAGDPAKEQWLWRDLTPLHLAIIAKSYDVAELLVDVSTQKSLAMPCASKDLSGDTERNFSPLLLAFEHDLKQLHRKIAKKFPTC